MKILHPCFYIDAQFWKEKEGDFDEQTTDDWDVDMSVYYEKKTSHDKDAVDSLDMSRSDFLRDGKHSESVFRKRTKQSGPSKPNRRRRFSGSEDNSIGSFEASSRGVGGRIMGRTGWRAGEGLGRNRAGISTPILGEEEGQGPADKSGLGYHGERLVVFRQPSQPPPGYNTARISSAFTGPESNLETFDRSSHNLYLKFTDPAVRFCRGGVEGKKNK